jgi:hypothetical protein
VLQCNNGVSSNLVEGRTKNCQLKDLILTLFGLIFRRIYIIWLIVLNATFSYTMATSFSGGRSRREPPTMGKQLVSFITCESSAPFFIYIYTKEVLIYNLNIFYCQPIIDNGSDTNNKLTRSSPSYIYIFSVIIYNCTCIFSGAIL